MFVPFHDANPLREIGFPIVTVGLIAINVALFLAGVVNPQLSEFVASFAIIPAEMLHVGFAIGAARGPHDALAVPEQITLLSYMFLHANFVHLVGNMAFLWVFGDNVEDALGHTRFLLFYLICGAAGAMLHVMMLPTAAIPMIGASAAVSGVIAAYLLLYPRVLVWVLVMRVVPLRITAAAALGVWAVAQVVMAFLPNPGFTAWWAHVGGLACGALLVPLFKRKGVRLLNE